MLVKMTKWAVALCVMALCLSLFGDKSISQMAPNDIIAEVNGFGITRMQIDRYMDMMIVLLKNRSRKEIPQQKVDKFRRQNIYKLGDQLLRRAVLSTNLAHSNIVITADARTAVEKECLRNYGKRKQTFEELKTIVANAGFADEFVANIDFDARFRSFITTVYSNEFYITKEKVATVKKDLAAYNKRAAETNRVTLALAEDLLKRIRKGEDFGSLADRYSADPEKKPGGDLGDCDESDFTDEKHIWRILSRMNGGDVSDVLETEDGYAIYKVVQRNTAEQSQTASESLTLSRIYFRRAYLYPHQSDDELWDDVERETREKLFAEVYKKFREQSKVTYPNGRISAK